MLVLKRNENQRIIIDNGRIIITVVEITPGRVRLGIEAPQDVPVHREEIQRRIDREEAK